MRDTFVKAVADTLGVPNTAVAVTGVSLAAAVGRLRRLLTASGSVTVGYAVTFKSTTPAAASVATRVTSKLVRAYNSTAFAASLAVRGGAAFAGVTLDVAASVRSTQVALVVAKLPDPPAPAPAPAPAPVPPGNGGGGGGGGIDFASAAGLSIVLAVAAAFVVCTCIAAFFLRRYAARRAAEDKMSAADIEAIPKKKELKERKEEQGTDDEVVSISPMVAADSLPKVAKKKKLKQKKLQPEELDPESVVDPELAYAPKQKQPEGIDARFDFPPSRLGTRLDDKGAKHWGGRTVEI
jgi:hypothetical protein